MSETRLKSLKPGEMVVYHEGYTNTPKPAVFSAALALAAEGRVLLVQRVLHREYVTGRVDAEPVPVSYCAYVAIGATRPLRPPHLRVVR